MMPDTHDAANVKRETDVAEIVARCSNIYTRFNLSPPMALRDVAVHWIGLGPGEIADILRSHLQDHRRLYVSGSGDAQFHMVRSAIAKALEVRYPPIERAEKEPVRPRRPGRQVMEIRSAAGLAPDLLVDDPGDRMFRDHDQAGPVEIRSNLGGYEDVGIPINLEDDAAEDA
jgi:hypothetical protein